MKRSLKLNAGCGTDIRETWINTDIFLLDDIDVVHDLSNTPWPFKDNIFEEIVLLDVLEHLPNTILVMEEIYRIAKPGSKIIIKVPYWNSSTAYGDPTHIRFFDIETFNFFNVNSWRYQKRKYYGRFKFDLVLINFHVRFFHWFVIKNKVIKFLLKNLSPFIGNLIHLLEVEFRTIK